jgi:hypothetical protein
VASKITILEPTKDRIEFTFDETELEQRISTIYENTTIAKEIACDAIAVVRVEIHSEL